MPNGTPINRQWIFVTRDGIVAIDWGNGYAQDIATGDFFPYSEAIYSHPADDTDLELLVRMGRVEKYDKRMAYVYALPERPQRTLD